MKTITRYLNGMATALLFSGMMASCAYDSADTPAVPTNSQNSFTLNVTTSTVGDETRAAYSDGVGTEAVLAAKTEDEKTVSSLVWSVFSKQDGHDGEKVWTKSWTSSESTNHYVKQENIAGNALTLKDNDVVVVAGNLGSTQNATYEALATQTAFLQNKLGIADALCQGGSTIDETKLPMIGKSIIRSTDADGTQFEADVTLKHMVAKVTLSSLKVNFTGTGHTSATFKPLEVFLINVPDQMTLEYDGTDYTPTGLSLAKLYQGEKEVTPANDKKTFADYLGTGTLAAEVLKSDNTTFSKQVSLFTIPYTLANPAAKTDNTRLVIKGEYCADGLGYRDTSDPLAGTNGTKIMYYAVDLKTATDNYNIVPNKLYKVSVTIKGPGADDAYSAIPTYQDMDVNISCADWEVDETTAFVNGGGIKWAIDYTGIQVGDIIYADGSWSTGYLSTWAATHGDPVAMVYSLEPHTADSDAGYTHGYAVALTDASTGAKWSEGTDDVSGITNITWSGTSTTGRDNAKTAITNLNAAWNNGRLNTAAIGTADANYPAFAALAAYNTAHKVNGQYASTWYIPSIGELYTMVDNLGSASAQTINSSAWDESGSVAWGFYYMDPAADVVRKNINARFTALITAGLDASKVNYFSGGKNFPGTAPNAGGDVTGNEGFTSAQHVYYWSSSEWSDTHALYLDFFSNGNLAFHRNIAKSNEFRVRPVLAF